MTAAEARRMVRYPGVTTASGLDEVEQIAVGNGFSCARRRDGTVWCWGSSHDWNTPPVTVPTPLAGFADIVDLVAGDSHACGLRRDGTVLCAGSLQAFGDVVGRPLYAVSWAPHQVRW
jgi:alpha-tubulin suppressor-like RCC1 family protein